MSAGNCSKELARPPETPLHQQGSDELAGRKDSWMMKNGVTRHVGQPSELSEVFWSVAVKNSVNQVRQFELNTFWDAKPMQVHQSLGDKVESPESVDQTSRSIEHRL